MHFLNDRIRPRYQKFINQHIGQLSVDRCTNEIRRRGITKTDSNECKETNTFIRATTGLVKPICGAGGEPYGTMRKSLRPFDIVVCTLTQGVRKPHCEYRGNSFTRKIAIACDGGFPVHFERDIVNFQ
uniref:Ribonuclease A-domain domain-containing protein n=1 Tax=Amphilophus citrinellus TaxID=61819 RepID=A0A3Q0SXI9_AMPCI